MRVRGRGFCGGLLKKSPTPPKTLNAGEVYIRVLTALPRSIVLGNIFFFRARHPCISSREQPGTAETLSAPQKFSRRRRISLARSANITRRRRTSLAEGKHHCNAPRCLATTQNGLTKKLVLFCIF